MIFDLTNNSNCFNVVADKSEWLTKVLKSSRLEERTDKFYQTLGWQLVDRDASREYVI